MKVGLVCPYDLSKPGGVQSQVKDLARKLREFGDEAILIGPGLPEGEEGIDLGPTVAVPGNRSRVPLSLDPRVGRKIRHGISDVDLLHVHEPFMPTVSLSALRVGLPVVATFHAAPGPIGTALYKSVRPIQARLLGPNVRKITAVSPTAAYPLADDLDISIVPNGVEVSAFEADVDRNQRRVAFLGRDDKRKGLDVLLMAWEQVSASVPEAELLVMGAVRAREGVTWLGPVDDAEKAEGLRSSAIYVAPNLGGESFGVVLVEGMAAGCAVVASDLDPFRDVGDDAVRYFRTGDSQDLVRVLVDLLNDSDAVGSLAAAGRRHALLYDWEQVVRDYRGLYQEALRT